MTNVANPAGGCPLASLNRRVTLNVFGGLTLRSFT
jgi:hypothetical protein